MKKAFYQLYGVHSAMNLLRPGARWEISNRQFSKWEDPRPCPTWEDVVDAMEKIKAMEDSIPTIFTQEQIDDYKKQHGEIENATT